MKDPLYYTRKAETRAKQTSRDRMYISTQIFTDMINTDDLMSPEFLAKKSVEAADALLKELEK